MSEAFYAFVVLVGVSVVALLLLYKVASRDIDLAVYFREFVDDADIQYIVSTESDSIKSPQHIYRLALRLYAIRATPADCSPTEITLQVMAVIVGKIRKEIYTVLLLWCAVQCVVLFILAIMYVNVMRSQ